MSGDLLRDGFWAKDVADPGAVLIRMANKVREADVNRRLQMVEHLCLYSNQPFDEYGAVEKPVGTFERISENHIENMIHTVHAETVQNRTRMTVVTSGGDYRMKERAKSLDKFSEGQAYEDGQEDVGSDVKLDALIWGTGVEKLYIDPSTNRVCGDRLPAWHLHVDRDDARFGKPRTIYEDYIFDREVLKGIFNSKKTDDAIDNAPRSNIDDYPYTIDAQSNLIMVHEGIHLPSRPADPRADVKADDPNKGSSGDGRHAMAVPGPDGLLFAEPWTKSRFPYEFIFWLRPRLGFWGKGMVEQLLGQQTELNRAMRHIQLSMKRAGNLKVLIDSGSKVLDTQVNDRIGTIVRYQSQGGNPPQFIVHDVVTPQLVQWTQSLRSTMYNVEGVSQMASQGMLPQGMDKASGRAIRTADSISSKRRLPFLRDCEKFDQRVAEYKIELAQEVFEKTKSYAVAYHGRRKVELVDWKDVNLKRDEWFMRVFPTSALPSEPSARIATLDEWLNVGLIDKPTYKRMADFPDLEDAETLESASYDLGEKMIDAMLYDGKPQTIEPLLDNTLFATMGLKAYCRAKMEGGFPEANMELLRKFILDAVKPPAPSQSDSMPSLPGAGTAGEPAPPEAPPGMPPAGMPPGAPPMGGALPPPVNQPGPPPGPPS